MRILSLIPARGGSKRLPGKNVRSLGGKTLAAVGRWKHKLNCDDLFLCEWIAGKQISMSDLPLSGRKFTQEDFDSGLKKIMSSDLLRRAFKNWCETGGGVEKFPLGPINPENWEPGSTDNPEMFGENVK